jgi:hypothetical protein
MGALLPLAGVLGERMPFLRNYMLEPKSPWKPAVDVLQKLLADEVSPPPFE